MPVPKSRSEQQLQAELKRLQARLVEAEATMKAIRSGNVDAIVVEGPQGSRIFTLRSAEEPYRILAERMNEGAATVTLEGTILFCNQRLAEMADLPIERLVGSSFLSILEDCEHESFTNLLRQASKDDVRSEGGLRQADGTILPVQFSLNSIPLAESGQGICLVATDLSRQKQAEEALRHSTARAKFAVESAKLGDWEIDLKTMETTRSFAHDQIFGYSSLLPEWNFEILLRHVHPEDRKRVRESFENSVSQGKTWEFECRIIGGNGDRRWIWARGDRYQDPSTGADRMFGLIKDITKRKQAEEALREKEQRIRTLLDSTAEAILVSIGMASALSAIRRRFEFSTTKALRNCWARACTQ